MQKRTYVFYNTLNCDLPEIAESEKCIYVWLPKDRFVKAAINHIIAGAAYKLHQVFIEDSFDLKGTDFRSPFSNFHVSSNLCKTKIKKIAFLPANDTIAKSFIHIIRRCHDRLDISAYTPTTINENANKVLDNEGIGYKRFSFSDLSRQKTDVLILGNDWNKEAKYIIAKCRKLGIKTICIQESVVDFGGSSARRMKWADIAFIQGAQTVLELDRKHYFITGNPRYENIEFTDLPATHKAFINCNFTYGIHEQIRNQWLTDIVSSLEKAKVEYLISQHPRDKGNLHKFKNVYRSNAQIVHQQLGQCSFVITRFSSLIHEALCMGKRIIYYNPHSESMKYDFGFDNNLLFYCKDKRTLTNSISSIINSNATTSEEHSAYLLRHCILSSNKPSETIVKLLLKSNLNVGDGLPINLWLSALRYYRYKSCVAVVRLITRLMKTFFR